MQNSKVLSIASSSLDIENYHPICHGQTADYYFGCSTNGKYVVELYPQYGLKIKIAVSDVKFNAEFKSATNGFIITEDKNTTLCAMVRRSVTIFGLSAMANRMVKHVHNMVWKLNIAFST